jgi:transposase
VFESFVPSCLQYEHVDRDSLEQLLAEGLSLAEIARRYARHESTVAYWVRKHGLEPVNRRLHARMGALQRKELERQVAAGMSIAQIASANGRAKASVRYWLGKYGLKTVGGRGQRSRKGTAQARAAGLARALICCPKHGQIEHIREPRGYYRCSRCRQEAVIDRRRRVKEILVHEHGGCCRLCGYSRCLAALEFHHLDPSAKEFGVARRGAHSIDRLRAEVSKCILLCSNCHAEVESGFRSVSGLAQMG